LYAVNYNGAATQVTPAGGQLVDIVSSVLPVPNSNSDAPTVIFRAFTGQLTPTDNTTTNLYSHTGGAASAVVLNSQAPVQRWLGGNVRFPNISPTRNYITFQVNSDATFPAKFEQYVVPFGGGTNVKVSPSLIYGDPNPPNAAQGFAKQTATATSAAVQWTTNGKYLIYVIDDNNNVANMQRGQLWSYQPAAALAVNLTVNSNASDVNSIPNGFSSFTVHCNQETLLYLTSLPERNAPANLFSVPLKGGLTVNVGFEPNTGGSVSNYGVFQGSFRVWYRSNFFGVANDLFVNTASAAFLLPSLALLFLALFF